MTPYLFGKYCLLERVSVGGMAEVFRAKPLNAPDFHGYLALKRILPHLAEDDEFIMMFVDEAKLTVQLNHPNIVKIYELGQFQASYYILMEFIAGKDLLTLQKRVRKRREVIGAKRSVYIAREMARGLHHAHQQVDANGVPLNIIHRDVSPQNVLVDYLGQIKVIDFGIAKAAVQSTRTQVGVLKGKMGYMSPEQVMGNPLDPRSDVFAIGTVLWEMLTNKRLFNGDNEFETMQLVKSATVDPPSSSNDEIPPDLDAIVLKALTADRNDRYPSALALAEALDGWLSRNPCSAEDLSMWMREVFAEDLEEELTKRDEFATIVTADDVRSFAQKDPSPEDAPQDNYEKTEIWSGELPSDVDPMEFAAQHTVVQAGGFDIDMYLAQQRGEPMAQSSGGSYAPMAYSGQPPMAVDGGFQSEGTQPGIQAGAPSKNNRTLVVVAVGLVAVFLVVAVALGAAKLLKNEAPAGAVLITALPATAQIKLNGQPVACTMPCRIDNLGVGKHLIEVSDEGYVPESLPVEILDGRVMPVDVVLKQVGPLMGDLKVAFPDDVAEMTVFLDGNLTTREALESAFSVEQGEHLVEVLAPGFRPFRQFVDVKSGASTVTVALAPIGFEVEIQGSPDSVLRLNGERRGTVPVAVTLDPFTLNEVEVSLRAVGVSRWKGVLALPDIAQPQIDLNFDQPVTAYKARDFGWLAASTGDDWWAVWVDDIDTGLVTPIDATKRLPLRKGKRVISFRRGYDRHDVEVDVRSGETLVMRENFDFVWKP